MNHLASRTAALIALACPFAQAAITSATPDSFDNGLGNWNLAGDVAIVSAAGNNRVTLTTDYIGMSDDAPLPDGSLNLSGNTPLGTGGDLESFIGTTVGALDLNIVDQAMEGSAISTTLNVTAGDILRFDWNLATRDDAGMDYGFIAINGSIITLAQASAAANSATGLYLRETGITQGEYVFTQSGEMTIAFGVVDVGDYSATTSLSIDNVQLLAVPEPASTLMLGLFSTAAVLIRKRRR